MVYYNTNIVCITAQRPTVLWVDPPKRRADGGSGGGDEVDEHLRWLAVDGSVATHRVSNTAEAMIWMQHNWEGALRHLTERHHFRIITNRSRPGGDGGDEAARLFVERLCDDSRFATIPVLVYTSKPSVRNNTNFDHVCCFWGSCASSNIDDAIAIVVQLILRVRLFYLCVGCCLSRRWWHSRSATSKSM